MNAVHRVPVQNMHRKFNLPMSKESETLYECLAAYLESLRPGFGLTRLLLESALQMATCAKEADKHPNYFQRLKVDIRKLKDGDYITWKRYAAIVYQTQFEDRFRKIRVDIISRPMRT